MEPAVHPQLLAAPGAAAATGMVLSPSLGGAFAVIQPATAAARGGEAASPALATMPPMVVSAASDSAMLGLAMGQPPPQPQPQARAIPPQPRPLPQQPALGLLGGLNALPPPPQLPPQLQQQLPPQRPKRRAAVVAGAAVAAQVKGKRARTAAPHLAANAAPNAAASLSAAFGAAAAPRTVLRASSSGTSARRCATPTAAQPSSTASCASPQPSGAGLAALAGTEDADTKGKRSWKQSSKQYRQKRAALQGAMEKDLLRLRARHTLLSDRVATLQGHSTFLSTLLASMQARQAQQLTPPPQQQPARQQRQQQQDGVAAAMAGKLEAVQRTLANLLATAATAAAAPHLAPAPAPAAATPPVMVGAPHGSLATGLQHHRDAARARGAAIDMLPSVPTSEVVAVAGGGGSSDAFGVASPHEGAPCPTVNTGVPELGMASYPGSPAPMPAVAAMPAHLPAMPMLPHQQPQQILPPSCSASVGPQGLFPSPVTSRPSPTTPFDFFQQPLGTTPPRPPPTSTPTLPPHQQQQQQQRLAPQPELNLSGRSQDEFALALDPQHHQHELQRQQLQAQLEQQQQQQQQAQHQHHQQQQQQQQQPHQPPFQPQPLELLHHQHHHQQQQDPQQPQPQLLNLPGPHSPHLPSFQPQPQHQRPHQQQHPQQQQQLQPHQLQQQQQQQQQQPMHAAPPPGNPRRRMPRAAARIGLTMEDILGLDLPQLPPTDPHQQMPPRRTTRRTAAGGLGMNPGIDAPAPGYGGVRGPHQHQQQQRQQRQQQQQQLAPGYLAEHGMPHRRSPRGYGGKSGVNAAAGGAAAAFRSPHGQPSSLSSGEVLYDGMVRRSLRPQTRGVGAPSQGLGFHSGAAQRPHAYARNPPAARPGTGTGVAPRHGRARAKGSKARSRVS